MLVHNQPATIAPRLIARIDAAASNGRRFNFGAGAVIARGAPSPPAASPTGRDNRPGTFKPMLIN